MRYKMVCTIGIWPNPFECHVWLVDGKKKTFGNYMQAQAFIDQKKLPAEVSPIEIYEPFKEEPSNGEVATHSTGQEALLCEPESSVALP